MNKRIRSRSAKPDVKPYGFCCSPEYDAPYRRKISEKISSGSLKSLHECPALKIQFHEIVERPKPGQKKNGRGSRMSSAVKLSLHSLQGTGGMNLDDATESIIDLMTNMMRGQRQAEYEQRMNRWAAIAEKKSKRKKKKIMRKEDCPHWYTDFSPEQLKNLKNLETALYEDHEESTLNRTFNCLMAIGVISNIVSIEPDTLKRLLIEYNANPIQFLYEVYKAVTGNYFEDEDFRYQYRSHERIILSAITFLELPEVILQLHQKLPPIEKPKLPPRPIPAKTVRATKMSSPLLEKLTLPPNWSIYDLELSKWTKQCLAIPKPIAILPKEKRKLKDVNIDSRDAVPEQDKDKKLEEKSDVQAISEKMDAVIENNVEMEKTKVDGAGAKNHHDKNRMIKEKDSKVLQITGEDKQYTQPFVSKNDWTEPPTPCPYKYRKLLNEHGPLKTDEEFFSELNPPGEPRKEIPPGRQNLSLKLQHFLLDVEADFHHLTTEADKLTSEVGRVAREIFDPEPTCDPCCACRETRLTHLKGKMKKTPHRVIDNVLTDEDNKTHVIGAMAMHSPASSISSTSQPCIIPSKDRLTKNIIITGTTTTIDGEPVNQIDGVTKVLEHIPQEILRPDVEVKNFRNVPPCACSHEKTQEDLDMEEIIGDKDEDVCYGQKFRPEQGPAYTCSEFNKNENIIATMEETIDEDDMEKDDCGCEESGECEEDNCGCGDDFGKCAAEESPELSGEAVELVNDEVVIRDEHLGNKDKCEICEKCGRKNPPKCVDKSIRKLFKPKKTDENKRGRKLAGKCSCDSLSQFLQLDITKIKCVMPRKSFFQRDTAEKQNSVSKKRKSNERSHKHKSSGHKAVKDRGTEKRDTEVERKSAAKDVSKIREEREARRSKRLEKESMEKEKPVYEVSVLDEKPDEESIDESGPYGIRTKSEEALPIERTIAYLVDPHPPDIPTEQIAVREGGRPCRCRENRNNRKTLLYGIAGQGYGENVIEGVTWVTPEPSIRRSDEYIPEYELYDSPYEEQVCGKARKASRGARRSEIKGEEEKNDRTTNNRSETEDQSRDWNNAFKDEYLTEFFTKEHSSVPCSTRCTKLKRADERRTRKLKVMKPVCECKYERRIVKRNEDRQRWQERQSRLKSLEKESYLHINEIGEPKIEEDESENTEIPCVCKSVDHSVPVIAAVTMQTPFATPSQSRAQSHLPYTPMKDDQAEEVTEENRAEKSTLPKVKSASKMKSKKDNVQSSPMKTVNEVNPEKKNEDDERIVSKIEEAANDKTQIATENIEHKVSDVSERVGYKRRGSYYKKAEEKLRLTMETELQKMSEDNFISLKLPEYNKLPQLSYWISYRVRGMCYSDKFKKTLMAKTQKIWITKVRRLKQIVNAEPIKIGRKDTEKLTYAHVNYWKRKIAKERVKFYANVREDIVRTGREMWSTMEFGKFPHLLFKQAYFTYLPAKEKDMYACCPFAE